LFTLMTQSGMFLPAAEGTEMSVFREVFADIGDEQSIAQSLSTFSSHMKNIVSILEKADEESLVLVDELGSGTDPVEGAALAMSILEELHGRRTVTLATTHYSELKAFALSTPGVENASVEFDVESLRPTYRLSIGIPGKSNAFEISRKLGLPESYIEASRELLSKEDIRFEDVIANAEYHRQIAERERAIAEETRRETVKLRNEAEKLRAEIEQSREKSLKKAKEEARRIMENARRESEGILRELKALKKQAATPEHEVQKLKKRMEEGIDALSEGLSEKSSVNFTPPKSVRVGESVEIVHLGTKGTVLSAPDRNGEVQIQAGIIKMKAHLSQLKVIEPEKPQKSRVINRVSAAKASVPMEIDVRGMTLEEAIGAVDIYLADATLGGLNEVSIIHGKGTGVLRAGIQRHLKSHLNVKKYRDGMYGEGEQGVTVVTLK
ncbi:MAG: Smr/MutS family protein, partial [Clostridia bacterium]|nr:Smr/MutS family protein [Clostridia bacterium]